MCRAPARRRFTVEQGTRVTVFEAQRIGDETRSLVWFDASYTRYTGVRPCEVVHVNVDCRRHNDFYRRNRTSLYFLIDFAYEREHGSGPRGTR